MGTGASPGLLAAYDALGLRAGALVAVALWIALLLPAHKLSMLSASYRMSDKPTRAEWLSRVNSNVHAVGATLGFYVAVFLEPADGLHAGGTFQNRLLFRTLLTLGLGYFLADTVIVLANISTIASPYSTLAHHALCVASVAYVMRQDTPLVYVWCGGMFLTEASTPFVNQRFFLAIRHREERRYVRAGLLMTVAFIVVRPFGIPAFMAWLYVQPMLFTVVPRGRFAAVYRVGTLCTLVLYALNVYWSRLMVNGLLRALRAKGRDRASGRPAVNGGGTGGAAPQGVPDAKHE